MSSFFDKNYQTPHWLSKKLSRRSAFKAAAGAVALSAFPSFSEVLPLNEVSSTLKTDPWLTLDAVNNHLLPASTEVDTSQDISAKTIKATQYLMNVVKLQPTSKEEINFIYQGVDWLNSYTESQKQKSFVQLTSEEKEEVLKAISRSHAGRNWMNNLIGYLYEAMLSPPIYGGNPNGIGWAWLAHQPGFPLPQVGDRFYELPSYLSISLKDATAYSVSPQIKRNKA